ncbi:hypothetical protein [Deminuibacter soli]|uniref:Uncharacterized protein n=1 Tax=Deminuibacter soli TaxID=2291815 RepID=A0A3E1NJI5_9BACT|nr:hypothetical protein [Deminuibacter soli]RFM28089.1 hypothetical protein DXN05_11185 [Deminuibacter soli]
MIKEVIDSFIRHNDAIVNFLESDGRSEENKEELIPMYAAILRETRFNPALGLDFASVLLFTEDKSIFDEFELADIRAFFSSLMRLQEYNLENYTEAAHFEWAMMNNAETAKKIIGEGIDKARQKMEELSELLEKIKGE